MKYLHRLTGALLGMAVLTACGGGGQSSEFTPQAAPPQHPSRHGTAGQITFYNLPDGSPWGITTGPDGALWAVQNLGCGSNSHIAQITTYGTVTEYPLGNCDLIIPTSGPDGALWISQIAGNGYPLARFTTGSGGFNQFGATQTSIGFYGLTTGSDGGIWIAAATEIVRSDTNGAMINYTIPWSDDPGAFDIAAGPDGALWFTNNGADVIGRITSGGSFSSYPIPTHGAGGYGITEGPDGAMWFVERNADKVGRIDMYGNVTEYPLPAGAGAYHIATGADGNLWITENSAAAIAKMTTNGYVTQYPMPSSCSYSCSPLSITSGPDGAMWFTLQSCPSNCYPTTPGLVGRITTDQPRKRQSHQHPSRKTSLPNVRAFSRLQLGGTRL